VVRLEARGAGGICSIFPFDRAHDEGHVLEVATLGTYFRAVDAAQVFVLICDYTGKEVVE